MATGPTSPRAERPPEYTVQEVGQMVFDLTVRVANDEKKIQSNRFAHKAFERQQSMLNKSVEDHLSRLLIAVENLGKKPPDPAPLATAAPSRGWSLPSSITQKPVGFNSETWPKLKFEPPRFCGEGVNMWIKKIQKYYNHNFTPLADRLYLTEFLLDDSAAEWFGCWETNNEGRGWDEFLMDIKRRFDPDLYEDYVGRLATLRQTGSLEDHLVEFESILKKVTHVGDATLTSLFIAGLTASLKHELLTRRPASLSDAIALAQQLAASHAASANSAITASCTSWRQRQQPRTTAAGPKFLENPKTADPKPKPQRDGQPPRDYPIIRILVAERAERTRKRLCWYCPEPYTRAHVCAKKFYALIGEDSDDEQCDEDNPHNEEEAENMIITGDVSSIHVIGPKLRPRSICITGTICETQVSVLIDGGSTHNFIKPAVAEKLSLPLHVISPFRVFVGNGASLRCDYASLKTPISLQGNLFYIDLFLLQVEGPDVILGVQWSQDLGDVTKNYRSLTMKFDWNQPPIFLKGEDRTPQEIAYKSLFSLIGHDPDSEVFEIVPIGTAPDTALERQQTTDPAILGAMEDFSSVFETPTGATSGSPLGSQDSHPLYGQADQCPSLSLSLLPENGN